jgi:two-component system cell cycle sensor histidine kinase/response regulator CckA
VGYIVLSAPGASEALKIARSYANPIHLLLTDIVMPRVSGLDLAQQVQEIRPGIKVLYMSGYTDNVIVQHGILAASDHFLQKPFSPQVLAGKVRTALDCATDAGTDTGAG